MRCSMEAMRSLSNPWRRALAGTLAALHLALALGAGVHAGPHLAPDIASLPYDLHHHEFAFAAAQPEQPHGLDVCVACQFSRLVPRLPAPAAVLPAVAAAVRVALPAPAANLQPLDLDPLGPRAPPIA